MGCDPPPKIPVELEGAGFDPPPKMPEELDAGGCDPPPKIPVELDVVVCELPPKIPAEADGVGFDPPPKMPEALVEVGCDAPKTPEEAVADGFDSPKIPDELEDEGCEAPPKMPVELEEDDGCDAPPNIPLAGVVSLLSLVLPVTVWLPKIEAEVVAVVTSVLGAAAPPNTEGEAPDDPKIDVVLLPVDPPNIPPVEAEEVLRDPTPDPPPNIPLGGEAAFSLPALLVAVVPKTDVPEDDDDGVTSVLLAAVVPKTDDEDDEVPPVAAVVTVVEPNTDLFGADRAVKGGGAPEELPESAVVGVTEAEETVLFVPPIPNTDELEAEVVIPPKTDDVVDVVPEL